MPNINDLVDPAELIGAVRRLEFPRLSLADYFPERSVADINYSIMGSTEDVMRAAAMRAFDAEAPIGRRPGVTRTTGSLPPISEKIPLTEGDQHRLRNLLAQSDNPDLVREVFADAARMVRNVKTRVELARGDALVDGIITINENGLQFTIDYGVPSAHKVTAAASWAVAATDIIGHLNSWVQTYVDTNGFPPERAIASRKVVGYLLANTAIREAMGTNVPTLEGVNALFLGAGLPEVDIYDVRVVNVAGATVRVIPDDRFIMLPGPDQRIGETQYGITAEATRLAERGLIEVNEAPGVVAVVWETEDPVQVWTKGAGIALPILFNPNFLFSADVVP